MKPKPDQVLHNKVDNLTRILERLQIELREERAELAREREEIQAMQERLEPVTVHATRVTSPIRTQQGTRENPPPARAARVNTLPARAARAQPPPARRAPLPPKEGPEFQEGDLIVVLNKYRGQQGRTATVTRVYRNKVYFSIDGNPTYCWTHNVERIG